MSGLLRDIAACGDGDIASLDFRDIASLVVATRSGAVSVARIVEEVLDARALARRPEAWLQMVDADTLRRRAAELDARRSEAASMPLFGVPFAIKDNIDAAGMTTTAGCPAYAYAPTDDAFAVSLLLRAGAVLVGRTHMDQFATGLTGTRSPHGPCRNAHVADRVAGGSSSGSAVVVAEGIVSFALGTDTAGSGRVPAVLNGVVGLKPTKGRISTRGVVPACASLDCVSVFAGSTASAALVLDVLDEFDTADPWSRPLAGCRRPPPPSVASFRVGVPTMLPSAVTAETCTLLEEALALLAAAGGEQVPVDISAVLATAELLYGGGWTAERDAAFGDFVRANPAAVDPTVARIVVGGTPPGGRRVFESMHELARLRRESEKLWEHIDVLVVPTVPRPWRVDEALAQPIESSLACGPTNNFMNLLDLAGCAIATGTWQCGVPFGVTLCAPACSEALLLDVGGRLHAAAAGRVPVLKRPARILLVVVGAHLEGMPLHDQLTSLDARLVAKTRTAATYRLYALAGTVPAKPGLRRVEADGAPIEVEVYALAPQAFGCFVAAVPRPLAIGRIALEDGSEASGFVCEPQALEGAEDITSFGGWRAWCVR